mgnify:CR=1 FL=1
MKLAVVCLLLMSPMLVAQVEQGVITGAVKDQTGAVVPRAKVTATNSRNGTATTTRTSAEGYYTIPYLSPSEYEIAVEADGFKRARTSGVTLQEIGRAHV